MHYQPMTPPEKQEMLQEMGVRSFEDLLRGIPKALRNPAMNVAEALSELEVQNLLRALSAQNGNVKDYLSFLGGGAYEHFVPAAVNQTIARNEFYTAYTPYQPEAAQGTLQALYEFQSLMVELTGLDVSNGSHYDGATSLAEAALLACRHTDRTRVLMARSLHPHYRRAIKTYLEGTPYQVSEFGFDASWGFDAPDLESRLGPDVAGVILQSPNFFGVIEKLEGLSEKLHELGTLLIMSAHPLSMAVLKTPGELGADVAAGEGQPLGVPLSFGGPYLGYFAVTRALMRRIPGRLAGMSADSEGRRAFTLTLQAREQHIRRERASSNICTNQALCALAACVYMTLMGKQGMREAAEINMDRAWHLRERISKLKGFQADITLPIFNEFVVKSQKPFSQIEARLKAERILPGIDLAKFYPEAKNQFLVCATETKSPADIERFVEALSRC